MCASTRCWCWNVDSNLKRHTHVPANVDGLRVIQYAMLPVKMLPKGYLAPASGPALEPIDLVVIAVGDEPEMFWVRCLNDRRETVTGEMYYSLPSAQRFLQDEYGVEGVAWQPL